MAHHIADFMVDATRSNIGMNNYIARELSPHTSQQDAGTPPTQTPTEEKEKFVWRMHQPAEPRKYQLFPAKENLSIRAGRKSPDLETNATTTASATESDRAATQASTTRTKPKEQSLIRRRKVSVPELGPMTTVQEVAMDSPTIPGRPPLHERSISAPGNSWRKHMFGDSMLSLISGPALDENAESFLDTNSEEEHKSSKPAGTSSPKQPLSPKILAPLVIPPTSAPQPRLAHQSSNQRLRSSTTPPEVPPKSARMLETSPYSRASPYTPYSASSTASHSTAPTPISNTNLSAPLTAASDVRSASPKPWNNAPTAHARGQSESSHKQSYQPGHRRYESEGGASIMDRGRPKKRTDGSPMKRKPSVRGSPSEEQRAFETLPQGFRAKHVGSNLPPNEIDILRKQAFSQASRFEVLSSRDVEDLSRELRGLDERCEYLRRTHRSLRAGRRNLHERICNYLRSPRVARFSHESILKQEEALSELDCSIDDWVSKLEQAENRRTRVRQKLLEHVAGALIMQPSNDMNTPPRSPTKAQSPQRLAEPVEVSSPEVLNRRDVESIRIYADSDISALLKDVEEEINRMGDQSEEEQKVNAPPAMDQGITLSAMAFSGH